MNPKRPTNPEMALQGDGIMADERLIAVFIDYENLAIGVRQMRKGNFKIDLVLRRLLEKGRIVYKRAYCDWTSYRPAVREFHGHGVVMVDIPQTKSSGKNSADIHMVVDALDLCYQKPHIDTFALISGDSDFSPLAAKLKENDRQVIGCGVKSSTSDLLIANCDEFIYYDDLVREDKKRVAKRVAKGTAKTAAKPADVPAPEAPAAAAAKPAAKGRKRTSKKAAAEGASAAPGAPVEPAPPDPADATAPRSEGERIAEALDLIVGTVEALAEERGGDEKVWGSMVKQAIKRVKPGFNESYYGFRSFNALLEEAQSRGLLSLERDGKSGGYALRVTSRE